MWVGSTLVALSPDATRVVHTRIFDAQDDQVPEARRWTRGVLAGHPRADDGEVTVSELFTNAITHTRSRDGGKVDVELIIITSSSEVIVYVTDGGSTGTIPHVRHPEATQSGGRGLHIVHELTSGHWGYAATGDHGRTWAVLALPPAIRAAAAG